MPRHWLILSLVASACASPHRGPAAGRLPANKGMVSTLAGRAGGGYADGLDPAASFGGPTGIAVDAYGTVYVADDFSHSIRTIKARVVSMLAGEAYTPGSSDGPGATARFYNPAGITIDAAGTVYVADRSNHTIRKITAAGVVSTMAGLAGSRTAVPDTGGNYGSADGPGATARFFHPNGVAVDAKGTVYVADQANHTIRTITAAGMVSTLAGRAGSPGSTDGPGPVARFRAPASIAVDAAGTVYVADEGNSTVRKITAKGVVSTLAGTAGSAGSTDGPGTSARFHWPHAVALDAAGNLYVADQAEDTIRKITPAGEVSTLAGQARQRGSSDGQGPAARFSNPSGLAVDGTGTIYVADFSSRTIRIIR